ncbi:MAG: HipA domain-containing protein, partial [Alphaproteobacteria bacterium]|nr:HipA domain-containing protein [Alphaproteobacteria bacterium]
YLYGVKVGVLSEDQLGHLLFQYAPEAKHRISVRMPVCAEQYDQFYAEPFFDNLTPEGDPLKIIASHYHVSEDNAFSILDKIGGDCAGAVSLYEGEIPEEPDSMPPEIDDGSLAKIVDELHENPLLTGIDNAPRLSLAGAQSKFAVIKAENGRYYSSNNRFPTTHIIKTTNVRFPNLLENELFCMKLARLTLGGNVKPGTILVEMKQTLGRKYLEIERYDRHRVIDSQEFIRHGDDINDMYLQTRFHIERKHQEDFCQVLGYLAKRKYQSDGGPKIRDLHNAVLEYSSQKATDSYKFIELLTFNYLIGNTDAHAKNFSLLHINGEGRIILAPAYDVLSTEVYPDKSVSHKIAMIVNGKEKYDKVAKKDWLALYGQLGLNPTNTLQEMKRNYRNIVSVAESLRDELNQDEITRCDVYDKIIEKIKERYKVLFDV